MLWTVYMAVVFNETDKMSDIFIFNTFYKVQQCESNHYPVIFDGERETKDYNWHIDR